MTFSYTQISLELAARFYADLRAVSSTVASRIYLGFRWRRMPSPGIVKTKLVYQLIGGNQMHRHILRGLRIYSGR